MLISLLNGALVKVDLPRLRLSFFVNEEGVLESKKMRAVVDKDQGIGCMLTASADVFLEQRS